MVRLSNSNRCLLVDINRLYVIGTRKTYKVGHVAVEEQAFTLSFFREFEHNTFIRDIIGSGGVYNADNIISFMVAGSPGQTHAFVSC